MSKMLCEANTLESFLNWLEEKTGDKPYVKRVRGDVLTYLTGEMWNELRETE